jgi:sirohydrochlorin ferrochelatase
MSSSGPPVLVGCAHGTRDAAGQQAVQSLLDAVRARRPALTVLPAFVDVQEPAVADVVARVTSSGREAVVVPLLLSTGYHARVDIAGAVAAAGAAALATPTLGPDARLARLLADRLQQAGADDGDAVVLAAAGSSDPQAAIDVEEVVAALGLLRAGPVTAAYGASAPPSVPEAVRQQRAAGHRRVVVAAYLLAPGFFHDRLREAGADAVTAPLAPDDVLVDIVLNRYDSAVLVS